MLLTATLSFAQKKVFLDDFGKKTKEKYASYYRIIAPEGNLFLVKDYYIHNDKMQMEGHYRSKKCEINTRTGQFTYYFENGEKASEGEYLDGKRDGKWSFWYKDGQLKQEGLYEKDEREGEWNRFHRNGTLKYKATYKGGDILGKFESVFDNGDKDETANYEKGKLDGEFMLYYFNSGSKVRVKGNYSKDSLHGTYEKYWRNGNISEKGEYNDNKKDGTWEYFHSNGNKSAEVEYKKGKFSKATYFDEDGKKLSKKVTLDDLYKQAEYQGGNDNMYQEIYKKLGEKADVSGATKSKYFFYAKVTLTIDPEGNITKVSWGYPDDDDDDYVDRWDFYKYMRSAIEDFPKFNATTHCNRYVEDNFTFTLLLDFSKK
ncbi:MAG: hypothetical protein IT245_02960 [Bacteroidia bacterium]|nr:hypothetical protein [Bacteroidia bacterium]